MYGDTHTALERATSNVAIPGDAVGYFGVDVQAEEKALTVLDCQGTEAMRKIKPTMPRDS